MKSEKHKEKVFYGSDFLNYAFDQTSIKQTLTSISLSRYLMRAIMAGIIVSFGYLGYILLDTNFGMITEQTPEMSANFFAFGHFFAGWFFGFCLIFIYYAKAELLTSNMMLFSVSMYYKKTKFSYLMKVLGACYLGNLIGGLFIGALLAPTSMINGDSVIYLKHVLEVKQGYTTSLSGIYELFIRAIFCNFFINLSMICVYSGNIKSDAGKALAMFGGVFFFMYLGLEHSVANSVFFAYAGFLQLFQPALDVGFHFWEATLNVIIVLIGNFIGGGVLIGVYYAFLNDKSKVLK